MQELIDVLKTKFELSHKKAKQLLTNSGVYVNNKVITKYNYPIKDNDKVTLNKKETKINDIPILYEDKNIIVVNKKAGLLTVSTDNNDYTLYSLVSSYVKKNNPKSKIFIVHRLDKDTSGLVILAKDEKTKKLYQDNWNELVKYRGYVAVVEGQLEIKENTIKQNLKENSNFKVYVSKDGLEAITKYQVIKENKLYSLLEIEIETGRKNQIRVAFESLNHPIIGDTKYSSTTNPIHRLGLHAHKLIIINPITNKEMTFISPIPYAFKQLLKSKNY